MSPHLALRQLQALYLHETVDGLVPRRVAIPRHQVARAEWRWVEVPADDVGKTVATRPTHDLFHGTCNLQHMGLLVSVQFTT